MDNSFFDELKKKYGINLNEQQKLAASHRDGPAVILAVPGAGKTTVLIARTANLILNYNINPLNILSVTFSRASANDMEKRFRTLFGNIIRDGIHFSTIHSFAYYLLRGYSSITGKKFRVVENNGGVNKVSILKKLHYEINGSNINDDELDDLVNSIGFVKNMMIDEKDFKKYNFNIDNFNEIYRRYERFKRENEYIDYDDMLTLSFDILKNNKQILEKFRERYKYIQIDEGQDTSKIQHEIIKLIASPNNNIFLVGDEDQCIYGFRGAYPDAIINFEKIYRGARVFFMEENFRSTKNIVSLANEFIKSNMERHDKNLFTRRDAGEPVRIKFLKDDKEQIEYTVEQLKTLKNLKSTAVLYRNNISAIPIADALDRNRIPFYLRDYKFHFFNHWVVLDIISFMNLSLYPDNIEAFERIYYKFDRYIPRRAVEYLKDNMNCGSCFKAVKEYPDLNPNEMRRLDAFERSFIYLSGRKPKDAIDYIESCLSYKDYLKDNAKRLRYSYESLNLILSDLKLIAENTKTIEEFLNRLDELKRIIENANSNRDKNAVTLSTVHSSKGLEFDNVYMVDLIEGQFPASSSINSSDEDEEKDIEEERRLFYVGMTRAKKNLTLVAINSKNDEKTVCSRFVGEVYSILNPLDDSKSYSSIIEGDKEAIP